MLNKLKPVLNAILFILYFILVLCFTLIGLKVCWQFLLIFFQYGFYIIEEDISNIGGFEFVSVFVSLCN